MYSRIVNPFRPADSDAAADAAIEAGVRRDSDGAVIPRDPANADWRAYQDWCAAGNAARPAPEPAPEPLDPPAAVSGEAIVGALSRAQAARVDVRDLARIVARDDVRATNAKLGRIAEALGTTPEALIAAARSAD